MLGFPLREGGGGKLPRPIEDVALRASLGSGDPVRLWAGLQAAPIDRSQCLETAVSGIRSFSIPDVAGFADIESPPRAALPLRPTEDRACHNSGNLPESNWR